MFAVIRVVSDGRGNVDAALAPVHVHGLGVNPADRALYIATHTGLWRLARGESTARRVGDSAQDTMGFTVVGARRFLGSGHPDLRTDLPPNLGLIESLDSGRTWTSVSLLGESDFHVLRYAGVRLYGYDATNDRLLTSVDRGRSWVEIESPGPLVDLAVQPGAGRVLVAAAADLLLGSTDGGRSWKALGSSAGLLGWPAKGTLYLIESSGRVSVSSNGGVSFAARGSVGGQPAAFLAAGVDELYVALHDGPIRGSSDGGRSCPSRGPVDRHACFCSWLWMSLAQMIWIMLIGVVVFVAVRLRARRATRSRALSQHRAGRSRSARRTARRSPQRSAPARLGV